MKNTLRNVGMALAGGALMAGCTDAPKPPVHKEKALVCKVTRTFEQHMGFWTMRMDGVKVIPTEGSVTGRNAVLDRTVVDIEAVRKEYHQYGALYLRGVVENDAQLKSAQKPDSSLDKTTQTVRDEISGRSPALGGNTLTVQWTTQAQREQQAPTTPYIDASVPSATSTQAVITVVGVMPNVGCHYA